MSAGARPAEPLLRPLLDAAADVLRNTPPGSVPSSLRALAGFDRKGLASTAARQQLRRALDGDDAFRDQVVERFLSRPEVERVLGEWSADAALGVTTEAARGGDLPLLASALFVARPEGWEFGLGAAGAVFDRQRAEQAEDADARAQEQQLAAAEEALRRAEDARAAAEARAEALERELRSERQQRRSKERAAESEAESAARRAEAAEAQLRVAIEAQAAAEEKLSRESERARRDEQELEDARAKLADSERARRDAETKLIGTPMGAALRYADLQALTEAADLARRLADGLGGVAEHAATLLPLIAAEEPAPASSTPAPSGPAAAPAAEKAPSTGGPERRVRPPVPPGILEDSPEGLVAMLQHPRTALVIDGYNLSMAAWAGARPAVQRWRLVAGLTALHARYRCDITVVFDGADVEGVQAPRRAGVRVLFSSAGEEADHVVVREAAARPMQTPVVVVSSDGWVRTNAEKVGARVVSSQSLAAILA